MATVTVRLPGTPGTGEPRRVLVKLGSEVLTLPLASPQVRHSELTANWVQTGRPALKPLQGKGPGKLRQMQFEAVFVAGGRPVEGGLRLLMRFGNGESPLTVVYGPLESGLWRLADITVLSEKRQPGTDAIVRAVVQLTFIEYVDDGYTKPASAQPAPRPATPAKSAPAAPKRAAARTHVVKAGETLSAIAARVYGDANRFGEIAKANKIRNPNLIRPGQKLVIP